MAVKRIYLTESRLYGLIRQSINEISTQTKASVENKAQQKLDKHGEEPLKDVRPFGVETYKRARRMNEDANDNDDWEYVLDYIECCDEKLTATIDWVIQACVKKARRGVVLDREHLANSDTLRRLCQIGVKVAPEYFEQRLYLSNEDKRKVREALADYILSFVNDEINAQKEYVARRVTESIMRKLRRM